MTDKKRYVISAPRSGLNWLRFCVEHFYGVRTPGQTALLSEADYPSCAFVRSHAPLHGKAGAIAWTPVDPEQTVDGRIVLILRHPLETFVRMAGRSRKRFSIYASNIRFYSAAAGQKRIVYYEDLVADPSIMAATMEFLALDPAPGRQRPTISDIEHDWADILEKSRRTYDVNQIRGGGAQTKSNPNDFKYHQRKLWWWERHLVWRSLSKALSDDELKLLDRYR